MQSDGSDALLARLESLLSAPPSAAQLTPLAVRVAEWQGRLEASQLNNPLPLERYFDFSSQLRNVQSEAELRNVLARIYDDVAVRVEGGVRAPSSEPHRSRINGRILGGLAACVVLTAAAAPAVLEQVQDGNGRADAAGSCVTYDESSAAKNVALAQLVSCV